MDVEKARVTGRAERLNAQAASFLTGRTSDVAERLFHGALVSGTRMKPSEDEQLQASSSEVMVAEPRGSLAAILRLPSILRNLICPLALDPAVRVVPCLSASHRVCFPHSCIDARAKSNGGNS